MDCSNPTQTIVNQYGTTNVTTGAWVQLSASLAQTTAIADIFDSSGSLMQLGIGPAGFEQPIPLTIYPGGMGRFGLLLSQGSRLSIRAVDINATSGTLVINLFR